MVLCAVSLGSFWNATPVFAQATIENTATGALVGTSIRCNTFFTRQFNVSGSGPVGSVSLGLNVTYNYRGALAGLLQSPSGTVVQFLNINGGDQNLNYDVLFQDGGGAINDGNADDVLTPFYDRTVAPSNSFSAFADQPANGTWTLYLCDGGSGATGTFNRSRLIIRTPSIRGFAFDDVNRDRLKDNNEGTLSNISVAAYRDDGDGVYEPGTGDPLVATTSTSATGEYIFSGLTNARYWINIDETDTDLAGRVYGGSAATNTADPRLVTYSGTVVSNVDFPFIQDFSSICEPGDPTGNLSFLEGATLESGSPLAVNAVYRFANVFPNVDALVRVAAFNGGASLAAIDNDTTGVLAAFQPTLSAVNSTTSSVDFIITFVIKGTTTPVPITFRAIGVDIDGDGNALREFIELTNLTSYKLSSDTSLVASTVTSGNRFESNTTVAQPGVSATVAKARASAQYDSVSQLRYRIGAIAGANSATQRLNSLFFGCTAGPTVSNPRVRLVKRITAINGQTTNPNDGTNLTAVVNDGVANSSDDESNWPAGYLVGGINAGAVKPGDDIEYTIYFLNAGGTDASNVKICDRLFPQQTFVTNAYGANRDVELRLGTSSVLGLTAASDTSDRTEFIAAGGSVPADCNLKDTNNNGTLVVNVTGASGTGNPTLTALPGSTGPGAPNNAYGLFRFKTRISP